MKADGQLADLPRFLRDIAVALWAGGLWVIGYLVAPILFSALADNRALAGTLAGRMFAAISWVGIACGAYLLAYELARLGGGAVRRASFWLVVAMLAIAVILQFWILPVVASLRAGGGDAAQRFALWHGISSAMYLLQSVFAAGLVWCARR